MVTRINPNPRTLLTNNVDRSSQFRVHTPPPPLLLLLMPIVRRTHTHQAVTEYVLPMQSCPWVGLGRVEIFQFWWLGLGPLQQKY